MQRQFAVGEDKIVTEGRDQGTVAFPDADIKFYLTAQITERARRRQVESRSSYSARQRMLRRTRMKVLSKYKEISKKGTRATKAGPSGH